VGHADGSDGFRIGLLGPVEAWVDGRPVALGGQRPRALFAVLALMGGRVVTVDRLIDELWGEEPPARARDSLQMHISRLRKGLAEAGADGGRLVSHAGGYWLELVPGECDVDRWQRALDRARRARADGELRVARDGVEDALGVWRGQPLGGVSTHSLLDSERARLEEERLAAVIEGIELDLELGRQGELLGQLEALVIAHPFAERLVELQMLALYRCGRQADALAAFQGARRRFVDELGIEPSQPLRDLHENILRHADTLGAEPGPAPPSVAGGRRLPVPPNRTIGRDRDVVAIDERLRAGPVRLLTLTGPGGVGKTRLALEAARAVEADFADGACFVSLASVHRADDVPAAIVQALGTIVLSGESADEAVQRFLAAKHMLLVVDNFEHVLAAAPFLGGLLEVAPALTVLATSREPLALHAEQRYPVAPLALPDPGTPEDPEALAGVDAVALFCERARAHDPDFELSDAIAAAVAEICRRVDGLPLAIELAAARCGLLSPPEIADRLRAALGALGAGARDAPARHQTLRATIDWSHDLLSEDEQACFARFAVFAGGATVEASETVTGADLDTLDRLVAKSLLVRRRQPDGHTGLGMLETIRVYATERFAVAADEQPVRERHYHYYLALGQRHGTDQALSGIDRRDHLARLDAETDNLRAAFAWTVGQRDAEAALAMVVALGWYWPVRHRHADMVDWSDQALALSGAEDHPAMRAQALWQKGLGLQWLGRTAEQPAVLADAESVARALGDPDVLAETLIRCSDAETDAGRLDAAAALADEASQWASVAENDWERALAARAKAMTGSTREELAEHVDRASSLLEEVGNVVGLGQLLCNASYSALCIGADDYASQLAERATPIVRELDTPGMWMILRGNTGLVSLLTGNTDTARDALREELELCRQHVALPIASEGLIGLAAVAVADGDLRHAAQLRGAAGAHGYGQQQTDVEARLETAFFTAARSRHGTDAWDAAVREGAALSLEAAIAYALGETHG